MVRSLGRALQICALTLPIVGLLYGLEGGPDAMALEIGFLAAGIGIFLLGRWLQREER